MSSQESVKKCDFTDEVSFFLPSSASTLTSMTICICNVVPLGKILKRTLQEGVLGLLGKISLPPEFTSYTYY